MKTLFTTLILCSLAVSLSFAQNIGNNFNFAMETRGGDGMKVLKAEEEQMIFDRLQDKQTTLRTKSISEIEVENHQLGLIKKQLDAAILALSNQNHMLEVNSDLLDQEIDEIQKSRSLIITAMENLWRENDILLQKSGDADEWTEEEIALNREQIQDFEMKINEYERNIADNENKIRDYAELMEENTYTIEKHKELAEACDWMKESNEDRISRMK